MDWAVRSCRRRGQRGRRASVQRQWERGGTGQPTRTQPEGWGWRLRGVDLSGGVGGPGAGSSLEGVARAERVQGRGRLPTSGRGRLFGVSRPGPQALGPLSDPPSNLPPAAALHPPTPHPSDSIFLSRSRSAGPGASALWLRNSFSSLGGPLVLMRGLGGT